MGAVNNLDCPRILDGGLATELIQAGFPVDGDPLWSTRVVIDSPRAVVDAHKRFIKAGATIIETCTYQAGLSLLQSDLKSSKEESIEVLEKAVKLARQAIQEFQEESQDVVKQRILVAGSIGPFGTLLCDGSEYTGKYMESTDHKEMVSYYSEQARALAGVDLLAFDTIPSLGEAECIVKAMETLPGATPHWISFSCKDEKRTCYGDSFRDAVRGVEMSRGIQAIGINCTMPDLVSPLLRSVESCSKPFVVYPNSGELWQANKAWKKNPECAGRPLASYVPEWASLGVKIFGGCCRIGPAEINDISTAVEQSFS